MGFLPLSAILLGKRHKSNHFRCHKEILNQVDPVNPV